jgi:GNAT superfamily N-acetyltransferase
VPIGAFESFRARGPPSRGRYNRHRAILRAEPSSANTRYPFTDVARPRPPKRQSLVTRELSPASWRDFEGLFRKYHGVQAGCWCMFYHREGPTGPLSSKTRREANRRDHRSLVLRGHAHGILVYRDGRPIGWCQFGRREDLPRVERGRKYRSLASELGPPPNWRITCFFVDRPFRRSGVARVALRAALEAIRRHGGGIVEGYPATHGRAVATWFGTMSMFEREGFAVVRPFGQSNVLVRREVR